MREFIQFVISMVLALSLNKSPKFLTFQQLIKSARIFKNEEQREIFKQCLLYPEVLKELIEEYRGIKEHFTISANDIAEWCGDDDPTLIRIKAQKRAFSGKAFKNVLNEEFKYLKAKATELMGIDVIWVKGLGFCMKLAGLDEALARLRVIRPILVLLDSFGSIPEQTMITGDLESLLRDTIHRTMWDHMAIESNEEISHFNQLCYVTRDEGGEWDATREDRMDEYGETLDYDGAEPELGEGLTYEWRKSILVNPHRFEVPKAGFDEDDITDITKCQVWKRYRWGMPVRANGIGEDLRNIMLEDIAVDKTSVREQYLPIHGIPFDPRINANRNSGDPSFVTMLSQKIKDSYGLIDKALAVTIQAHHSAYVEKDNIDPHNSEVIFVSKPERAIIEDQSVWFRIVVKQVFKWTQVWIAMQWDAFSHHFKIDGDSKDCVAFQVRGGLERYVLGKIQPKKERIPFCIAALRIHLSDIPDLQTMEV